MAGFVSEIESLNQRESKGERHSRKDDDRRVWEGREWDRIVRDFFGFVTFVSRRLLQFLGG
jgi:hypothetical protein